MHLWSEENPRITRLRNFQTRWMINIWAGIMGTEILGSYSPRYFKQRNIRLLRNNLSDF